MVEPMDSHSHLSKGDHKWNFMALVHVVFISRNPKFKVPQKVNEHCQVSVHHDYQHLYDMGRFRKIDAVCFDSDSLDGEIQRFLRHRPYQRILNSVPTMVLTQDLSHNLEFYAQLGAEDYYAGALDSTLFWIRFRNFIKLHCSQNELSYKTENQVELAFMAYYDRLTNLPNRQLFQERVEEKIRSSGYQSLSFALLFLDLDDFKDVNDQNNHQTGDWLLNQVGLRLKNCLKKTDTVARLGGDEFCLLIDEVDSRSVVEKIAHRVLYRLSAPYGHPDGYLRIHVSIGIALFPQDGKDYKALLAQADQAMYQAKKKGKGQFTFAS